MENLLKMTNKHLAIRQGLARNIRGIRGEPPDSAKVTWLPGDCMAMQLPY